MTSEDAEHVTAHLYRHRERFTVEGLPCPDLGFRPGDRLVVDDEEDLARARWLVSAMSSPSWEHGLADVAALLRSEDGTV